MPPSPPDHLLLPLEPFGDLFAARCNEGLARLKSSTVAFVGLARNCAVRLAENLGRLEALANAAADWCLHIETNDNTDATVQVLTDFCRGNTRATFTAQSLGRQQYGAEFAGPRTIALAEYRAACQQWVRECAADADYVVAIDWDQWGGWSTAGVLNGLGWLVEMQGAYGMASVSLLESQVLVQEQYKQPRLGTQWLHYDAWALRGVGQPQVYWDDYTKGLGGWKHHFLPPVGSPPVVVASAFGGLCIYRTAAYLKGSYDGTKDCEHVPFHESIARATGQRLYLCPAMRCVMQWLPEDAGHARQHGND